MAVSPFIMHERPAAHAPMTWSRGGERLTGSRTVAGAPCLAASSATQPRLAIHHVRAPRHDEFAPAERAADGWSPSRRSSLPERRGPFNTPPSVNLTIPPIRNLCRASASPSARTHRLEGPNNGPFREGVLIASDNPTLSASPYRVAARVTRRGCHGWRRSETTSAEVT